MCMLVGFRVLTVFTASHSLEGSDLTAHSSHVIMCVSTPDTDTMIQVASSFSTEPSLDMVLSSIPARIYEAINFLKENMESFTAKVRLCVIADRLSCLKHLHCCWRCARWFLSDPSSVIWQ